MRLDAYLLQALLCALAIGCSPNDGPRTGSQTNWLRSCTTDLECGAQSCHCGVCTHSCATDAACSDLPGSACVAAADPGAIALCGGSQPADAGLCMALCGNTQCAAGQSCVAGICSPIASPSARISVHLESKYQQLTGFGATLAYAEPDVTQHPNQPALYDTMFANLGLDILRLRNRYQVSGDDDLTTAAAIVDAASVSLGHRPTIVLASWSPPTSLKSNGATVCRGEEDNCTMTRLPAGGFDYDAYATYWRGALDAYAAAGVSPDFIGIQNNPDFVPTAAQPGEGCKFLPTEGTATVSVNGTDRSLEFPGFVQALDAVMARLQGLAVEPKIIAPEVSAPAYVAKYVDALDVSRIDAIGHHLYGMVPSSPNVSELQQLYQLAQSTGRPVFQTEMAADGLGTAELLYHTLVTEGASAYLHFALVGLANTATAVSNALVTVDSQTFSPQPPYHAIRHYALHTDPGWIRVGADSNQQDLLASAWLSPTGNALTIVVVNSGTAVQDVELGLGSTVTTTSSITRTVFDGVERSAELGALSDARVLRLPGHSMATVALEL